MRNWKMMSCIVLASVLWTGAAFAADGLVAHYSFEPGQGTAVNDGSGQGNDGKILGGATRVKGKFGTALSFDGVDDYVDCGAKLSLDIGKASTIMFWFKPKSNPQGGLVGWATGTGMANQRLVVSLNTLTKATANAYGARYPVSELGLYISDGQNSDYPFRSNEHEPYFPRVDQWLFYTVTFDGRAVEIYRDGVHVETRFQTVVPDTVNVPMLIGRCSGVGGSSDYFKGLIDEVRIFNRPLSQQEVYKLFMRDAKGRDKNTTGFGSINIKPIVMPRAGHVFADLDYRGLVPTTKNLAIKVDLQDAKGASIARGKIRMLPAWGRAEAVFDVAKLPAGKYTVSATATKGKPASLAVNWPGRAKGWENVKVLNNLCWELLNEPPGTKAKSEYTFTNPRRSWVYFVIETEGDLTLTLPGAKPEIIHGTDKVAKPAGTDDYEAMRWLEKGEYKIVLTGKGKLKRFIVRSVPILAFHLYPHVGPGTCGDDTEFLVKHVLSSRNTILTHDYGEVHNPDQFRQKWASGLGRHVYEHIYPYTLLYFELKADTVREQVWDFLTSSPGLNKPEYQGVDLDEFAPGDDWWSAWNMPSYFDEWMEVCTKILDDPKYAGRFIKPSYGWNMFDFEKSSAFLRMFVARGCPLVVQAYIPERDTEEQAWVFINETLADLMDEREQAVPGSTELTIILPSHLHREIWNPGVNFKVHLEMQFEQYATRPEFFAVGGIQPYKSYGFMSGEEYVRWLSKLCRHYGLEGNTERLSKDPYESVQISNPDFINGTEDWTLQPAEMDSMAVKSHKGYGVLQVRITYKPWTDTPFLWTKRSAQKPNVFSQEIHNLEAGQLYFVRVWISDYNELLAGASKDEDRAISISVDGGKVWDDWYRTEDFTDKGEKSNAYTFASTFLAPFVGQNRYYFKVQRLIFRAEGPTATLKISDWKDDAEPGGPVGQELIFNRIDVHPYLEP